MRQYGLRMSAEVPPPERYHADAALGRPPGTTARLEQHGRDHPDQQDRSHMTDHHPYRTPPDTLERRIEVAITAAMDELDHGLQLLGQNEPAGRSRAVMLEAVTARGHLQRSIDLLAPKYDGGRDDG